jgi:prepilin-type N-terminal cleavage/methylation domain-containing protein
MKVSTNPRGFTLAELLVVIGIIAILASIILPVIGKVQDEARRKADKANLLQLRTALGTYEQDWQDYPPTLLKDLGFRGGKPTNQGIESVVATLSSEKRGSRYYEFADDMLGNTDEDKVPQTLAKLTGSYIQSSELFEVVDSFGNPFVYIHHRDYAKPEGGSQYLGEDGLSRTIAPQRSEKTKEWFGAGEFQMWGFGPNGENENGSGDDVATWQ